MAWGETTSGQTTVRYLPGGPNFMAINLLHPLPSSPILKSPFFSMDGSHNQHQNEGHASALPLIVLFRYRNTNIKFPGITSVCHTMTRFISSSLFIISHFLPMHSDLQEKLFFGHLGFPLLLYFSSAIDILLCGWSSPSEVRTSFSLILFVHMNINSRQFLHLFLKEISSFSFSDFQIRHHYPAPLVYQYFPIEVTNMSYKYTYVYFPVHYFKVLLSPGDFGKKSLFSFYLSYYLRLYNL